MVKNWREETSHRSANIPILNDNTHRVSCRRPGIRPVPRPPALLLPIIVAEGPSSRGADAARPRPLLPSNLLPTFSLGDWQRPSSPYELEAQHLGLEVQAPQEVKEIGEDIVKRIEHWKAWHKQQGTPG